MPRPKTRKIDIEREICRGIAWRIQEASNNFRKSATILLAEEEARILSEKRTVSALALAIIGEVMLLPEQDREKIIVGIIEKRLRLEIYTRRLRIHWMRAPQ